MWSYIQMNQSGGIYLRSCLIVHLMYKFSSSSVVGLEREIVWLIGNGVNQRMFQECLLLHLETLLWTYYEGIIEDEEEVVKYILRNASRLKKATFTNAYIRPEKRLERLEELKNVVMASNSCQLLFKEPDNT